MPNVACRKLAFALAVALSLAMANGRVIAGAAADVQATDAFWSPALAPFGPPVVRDMGGDIIAAPVFTIGQR